MIRSASLVFLLLLSTLLIPSSCKEGTGVGDNQEAIVRAAVQDFVLPDLAAFAAEAESLNEAVMAFSAGPDALTLETLRYHWVLTYTVWKKVSAFNVSEIRDQAVHNRISKWPTNTENLDVLIGLDDPVLVSVLGSTTRGLPAMEYLLFGPDPVTADALLLSDSRAERRRYLLGLFALDIVSQTADLQSLWLSQVAESWPAQGREAFAELYNRVVELCETQWLIQLGKPLGIADGSGVHPEQVECPYAGIGLEMLLLGHQYNAQIIGLLDGPPPSGPRISDRLADLEAGVREESLVEELGQGFETIQQQLEAIPSPLGLALSSNNAELNALYADWGDYYTLLKVDGASILSVIITLSDADGD